MSSQSNAQETEQSILMVELFRETGDPSRAHFSCSLADWNFLRQLGKTFGWHPLGTTYLPQQGERARHKPIKHDYQPGDTRDRKRVEADDCAHWAAALEAAKRTPFIDGMLRMHAELQAPEDADAVQALQLQLQTFIEFIRRGSFTISLRPEPVSHRNGALARAHNSTGSAIRAIDARTPRSNQ